MIPIRDTSPVRRTPIVNYALIGANLLAFLYELWLPPPLLDRLIHAFAFVPARLWAGPSNLPGNVVTILVAMFLHGGFVHFVGNMLYLYIFGDNIEDRLGHGRYLFFYLLCGGAASLAHAFFNPASRIPSLGASGAISGVLGAYMILYPTARVVTLIPIFIYPLLVEIPALFFLLFWFVLQFFSGALSLAYGFSSQGGVAYFAHVGGFVAGILLLPLLAPRRAWRRV